MSTSPPPYELALDAVKSGVSLVRDDLYPAVETAYDTTLTALDAVEGGVDAVVRGILSVPGKADDMLPHSYIPNDILAPGDLEDTLEEAMGFDRREREVSIVESGGIPNTVTLIPGANDPAFGKRSLWNMFAEDGLRLNNGYTELEGDRSTIFAPFSTYYPTSMWPYSSRDGTRYTVHDLGNEPIDSDFLGTKPLVESMMGRKLDKVGALPAFSKWGDIALGAPPTILYAGLGTLAVVTAPSWIFKLGDLFVDISDSFFDGLAKITINTIEAVRGRT